MTKLEKLTERLELYREAERKVLQGVEYAIGDRRLRRADLATIRNGIVALEDEIAMLETPGRGIRRAVFVDD